MSKEDFILIFLHINAILGQPCVVKLVPLARSSN